MGGLLSPPLARRLKLNGGTTYVQTLADGCAAFFGSAKIELAFMQILEGDYKLHAPDPVPTSLVRASPRVCHILLDISCVLPISKKICQVKKRGYLQQFGIIHLSNSDLTYIRNSERETKLYLCPSTS